MIETLIIIRIQRHLAIETILEARKISKDVSKPKKIERSPIL